MVNVSELTDRPDLRFRVWSDYFRSPNTPTTVCDNAMLPT